MSDVMKTYQDVIIKGLILLGLVVLLAGALLYPLYSDLVKTDAEIKTTKLELERQKIFTPQYALMQKRSKTGNEIGFPVPTKESVAVRNIGEVPGRVEEFAESVGMRVLDVVISPGSLKQGGGKLMLQAVTSGTIESYWDFYSKLGAWGAVSRISNVEIQAVPDSIEFNTEFWLNISGSNS